MEPSWWADVGGVDEEACGGGEFGADEYRGWGAAGLWIESLRSSIMNGVF